jgi:Tol biopolymer transport system component
MEDAGAKLTVMSIEGAPLPVPAVTGRMFRWTPDGKSIAYIRRDGKQENVFIQPLAGGPSAPMTAFPEGSIANYEWSPDGQRIVLTHYLQMCDVVLLNPQVKIDR